MCFKLSGQPLEKTELRALVGQGAHEMVGPWGSYRKLDWKHEGHPVFLPGMSMLFPALILKKDNLELVKVQRNAIKMIKGSKGGKGRMPY